MKPRIRLLLVAVLVLLLGIQLIPVERSNPPVTQEVRWNSPETRALAERACFDCHSNETVWPWYSYVAPVSWRVEQHVRMGRAHLNFSEWDGPNEDLDEMVEEIEERGMPLQNYLRMHAEARLSDAQREQLVAGLTATMEADPPIERQRRRPVQ